MSTRSSASVSCFQIAKVWREMGSRFRMVAVGQGLQPYDRHRLNLPFSIL